MVFFILVCKKNPIPDVFFYSHYYYYFYYYYYCYYFIPNIIAICKNNTSSSEPEMISKELENSHVSSFNVNLTDIFKMIAKYHRKCAISHVN